MLLNNAVPEVGVLLPAQHYSGAWHLTTLLFCDFSLWSSFLRRSFLGRLFCAFFKSFDKIIELIAKRIDFAFMRLHELGDLVDLVVLDVIDGRFKALLFCHDALLKV